MNNEFFFDTYALIELIEGNAKYQKYQQADMIINEFVFAELCYFFERNPYVDAHKFLKHVENVLVRTPLEVIQQAMQLRFKLKPKKLSMADAIGYAYAKELGLKFLTGDKEFKDMDNVEFVAK